MKPPATGVPVHRWTRGGWTDVPDDVVLEEPLQLMLNGDPLSVVMRTPGNDVELALGLFFGEGIVVSKDEVAEVRISAESPEGESRVRVDASIVDSNTVDVRLRGEPHRRPERSMLASSACGVCGATMIDDLKRGLAPLADGPRVAADVLGKLGDSLRSNQGVFDRTGGLHAAALFTADGGLVLAREDVGRHNAVDKVVGRMLLDGRLPCREQLLVVSGRAGYEIVQKSIAAGIPLVAAVGAPSSLAVALAREFGQTLVGFLRSERFNVYAAPGRVA